MSAITLKGRPAGKRQRGAALVIGLILLLILTVLGVSGLGTASMEVRFADNAKQREYAFQGAESALREELRNGPPIVIAGTEVAGDLVRPVNQYQFAPATSGNAAANVVVSVESRYRDRAPGFGAEFGLVENIHFELAADSTAARGARSRQRQGFYIPAPAP